MRTQPTGEQRMRKYGLSGEHPKYMTVADVIKVLQTLDQSKVIYVQYDSFCDFAPLPDTTDINDDYVITAG